MSARVIAVAAAVVAFAAGARAQSVTGSIMFDDYGLTRPLSAGARNNALGGATVASINDGYSLASNPAGLARVKRIEIGMGIQQERVDAENTFFGTTTGVDTRSGGFESLSIAVPLPTYRGSFVGAFGVYRLFSSNLDLHYAGENAENETRDNYLLQQSGALYSYNLGFGVDLSPSLSGGMSVFVIDGTIDGLEQYDFSFTIPFPASVFVTDERVLEVDGIGARVGAQFFFHRLVRAGFAFTSPILLDITENYLIQEATSVENGIDTFRELEGERGFDLLLPFRLDMGLAGTFRGATVSLQLGYSDWAEAAIDRTRLRAASLETAFREVFDYRAGVEYTLTRLPLRLRAGYAYLPYPLKFMQGDRIDRENFERASFDEERHEVSFGVGALVGSVLTVDAAYSHTRGQRSLPSLNDTRAVDRFFLSASYRF